MPIATPEDLREHIELAMRVELTTIPPYLFAMYSIEGPIDDHQLAAPTLEVYQLDSDDRAGELAVLATAVADLHPNLVDVLETVGSLS